MDLNKTKTFIEVVELGSVTRAAEHLNRTQQAISQQLKSLENELGFVLFHRNGPKIVVTPQGKSLYEELKDIFERVDDAVFRLKTGEASARGTIKLGLWMGQGCGHLSKIITDFTSNFTDVDFRISVDYDSELESALINGDVDFGIFMRVNNKSLVETHTIFQKMMVPVASPEYLNQHSPITCIEDTFKLNILDFTSAHTLYSNWVKENTFHLYSMAKCKSPSICIKSDYALKDMVLNHAGMALVPEHLVREELASGALVRVLDGVAKPLSIPIILGYKKNQTLSYIQREFIVAIKEYGQQYNDLKIRPFRLRDAM